MHVQALSIFLLQGLASRVPLLMTLAMFAIFYVLLILPTQRRQKKLQQMIAGLKTGDHVITAGGLRGTIINLKDDSVYLRLAPDQIKVEVLRSAVTHLENPETK